MDIGVPKEIKADERRLALTPQAVSDLIGQGHCVNVETMAGAAIGFSDDQFRAVGAHIQSSAQALFERSQLIVKVKEPQPSEVSLLDADHILFTYLHLAASRDLTEALCATGATCIAYETVMTEDGQLPLLAPMSEVAGRLAVQLGAYQQLSISGGIGQLLGGVSGVAPVKVVILGAGIVGTQAARVALGLGARVVMMDINADRLRQLQIDFQGRVEAVYASRAAIMAQISDVDLLIGAVLIPGAAAPKLLRESDLKALPKQALLVDVAIDQGGCFETSRPTTHHQPVYEHLGLRHYCVANIPSAAARTATEALVNATASYVSKIATRPLEESIGFSTDLAKGVNIYQGQLVQPQVAESLGLAYESLERLISL